MFIKDCVKLVINHFFIITVAVLFFTGASSFLPNHEGYPSEYPWIVLLTGVLGALPSLFFCFRKEPTKTQFVIRCAIHFILIEAIVMCEGALVGWYDNLIDGLIIFVSVVIIYAFVWFYSYKTEKKTANNINDALSKLNEED